MLFTGSAKKNAKKQVQLCAMILFKILALHKSFKIIKNLEMWANAQRDGRPAKYRWRPLFNAAKFG